METTPSENLAPSTPVTPTGVKNTFLLVICILTFIGSGFGVLGSIFSFATADTVSAINSKNVERMETQQTPGFIKSLFQAAAENMTPDKIKESALAKLVSCLLTLFGAIMMLKLKKSGFYLYVAGILIFIMLPIYIVGGFIGMAGTMFDAIIGIAFVIMYAVNLKYMNKQA